MNCKETSYFLARDIKHIEHTSLFFRGKWKLLILQCLFDDKKRFNEIVKAIPKITTRMLSRELKDLEGNRLIDRICDKASNGIVDYQLTDYGRSFWPILYEMIKWSEHHSEVLIEESDA
ncbi:winged helix-turn-helix transcriptional regulator [Pedobacter sp. MC2016-14]|uniref:winged helix-turn-helix transcriptional regulator n=1 Tax=Pedobacter sp. MC2016-14 TaxID=2897327 RepID=UPI001E4ACAA4|nr:winged helix-turn-helix transcriptional regulator [Pedobacter sp. MC2016-14]MCD0490552.1 winged helix-turn-helix transcriptional regulator [Pedobacter sp. MC2016-14]